MSTRDPGWNQALSEAGRAILQAAIERAQMNYRYSALAQDESQFQRRQELDESQFVRNLDLNTKQFLLAEQSEALDRTIKLFALAPPGTTIAQNPFLHEPLAKVLPGENPADTSDPMSLGNMVITPETWETVMRPVLAQRAKDLQLSGGKNLERVSNRVILGLPATDEELKMKDDVVGLQARALDELAVTPQMLETVGRSLIGLETIRIPIGKGKTINFDNATAANIWARLYEQQLQFSFGREMAKGEKQVDFAGEFMKQAKDVDLSVSRPTAEAIIGYTNMAASNDPKVAAAGQAGINKLMMSGSTEVRAATSMYLYGAKISEATKSYYRQQNPALDAWYTARKDAKDAGFSEDELHKFMPQIAKIINRSLGFNEVPVQDNFAWFNPADWFGAWGLKQDEFYTAGSEADANLDAQKLAAGRITLGDLTRKWGTQPDIIQSIVRKAAMLRGAKKSE